MRDMTRFNSALDVLIEFLLQRDDKSPLLVNTVSPSFRNCCSVGSSDYAAMAGDTLLNRDASHSAAANDMDLKAGLNPHSLD